MSGDWKYCPYCGKPINECECNRAADKRFPAGYAEVEYNDFDNAEAIDGAKFDDLNFQRHYEK